MSTGKNCEDEVTAKRRALCPPKLSSTSIALAKEVAKVGSANSSTYYNTYYDGADMIYKTYFVYL